MPIKMLKPNRKISQDELLLLEANMGRLIPQDFKEFMITFNGGEPEFNQFFISEDEGSNTVRFFNDAVEIIEDKKLLKGRLPDNAWPIADVECGDLVCLVLGPNYGIYYWDHEWESDDDEPPTWRNMYFLAPTFTDFWNSLQPDDPDDVVLKPDQVKEVWTHPDYVEFLAKYRKDP